MALGVIPPLCATLGPVLAGPEGCSRGRWRSGSPKWRHTAAPEGRGQGAPRTCRCIETGLVVGGHWSAFLGQGAPRTCRCIETDGADSCRPAAGASQGAPHTCRCIETSTSTRSPRSACVREHHTPVGALRRVEDEHGGVLSCQEGYSGVVLKTWSVKVVVTVRSSGRFPAQPRSAPDGRLAWWDGVSHVVTRPGSRARHSTREIVT